MDAVIATSGGWEQDRTEGEPGNSNTRALPSAISSPWRGAWWQKQTAR